MSDVKYLEIGINNPVANNNSFHLYTFGARGVLVDALAEVACLAEWVRPEDTVITKAVLPNPGTEEISFFINDDFSAGISSVIPDRFNRYNSRQTRRITVPAIYINDLLASLDFLPDVLLIDAEGLDEQIIRAIRFDRFNIPIILVEVVDLSHEEYVDFVQFMRKNGYGLYYNSAGINAIFVMENLLK